MHRSAFRCVPLAAVVLACGGGDSPTAPPATFDPATALIGFSEAIPAAPGSGALHSGIQLGLVAGDGSGARALTPSTVFAYGTVWAARANRAAYRLDDGTIEVVTDAGAVVGSMPSRSPLLPLGGDFRLSGDGTRLSLVRGTAAGEYQLVVREVAGGASTVLASSSAGVGYGAWSPDDAWIVHTRGAQLWRVRPDGTGQSLVSSLEGISAYAWSADARRIAVTAGDGVWIMDADGRNARRLTGEGRAVAELGEVVPSPDGTRLAGRELGVPPTYRLVVIDAADGRVVSRFERATPGVAWSPDGSHLAYVQLAARLVLVRADGTGERVLRTGALGAPHWLR